MNINFKGILVNKIKDDRDYHISKFTPNNVFINDEEFIMNLPKLQFVKDQGNYNACVGYSYSLIKSILEYQYTNKWIDFSPFMIYGTRLEDEYNGEGMYPIQGAKVLYNEGAYLSRDFKIEAEMPELKTLVDMWKKNNPDKVIDAKNYTITGYSRVNDINDMKKALKNKMPISAAFPMYDTLFNESSFKDNTLLGYHQMTIVGWTKNDEWIVINSWGVGYGLDGIYHIPFTYPIEEAYAISDTIIPSKCKAKNISFYVNHDIIIADNVSYNYGVNICIKDYRTMVPIRMCELLGCSVEWIPVNKTVIVRSEEALIELQIDNKIIKVNDNIVNLPVSPQIINDRVMVPIRFICNFLNCDIKYNEKQHITINCK